MHGCNFPLPSFFLISKYKSGNQIITHRRIAVLLERYPSVVRFSSLVFFVFLNSSPFLQNQYLLIDIKAYHSSAAEYSNENLSQKTIIKWNHSKVKQIGEFKNCSSFVLFQSYLLWYISIPFFFRSFANIYIQMLSCCYN